MSRRSRSATEAPAGPLPRAFYGRPVLSVARALLGRTLVRGRGRAAMIGTIVEVEAYRGADDPASHAHRGRTPRNAVMFGPAGRAYVYFTYGMHHCVNVVCERDGRPSAVLLRAAELRSGIALAARRRGRRVPRPPGPERDAAVYELMRGPGRLARALGLTRAHDGADLTRRGPLWISSAPPRRGRRRIASGRRIGIRVGTGRRWRFWLEGHPAVSGPRRAKRVAPRARPSRVRR